MRMQFLFRHRPKRLQSSSPSLPQPPLPLSPPAPGCPIAVAAARVPMARPGRAVLRFATGWGASVAEACRGCALEAAERLSAQAFGSEQVSRGPASELGTAAVWPPDVLLISGQQYAERQAWNAAHPGLNEVPAPWQAERPTDWVSATAALSSTERWLPAALCFLGYPRRHSAGLPAADSSGVAAGSTIEDAAVRAFLELAERDAVAIWWYNRLVRPQLKPADFSDVLIAAYGHWSQVRGRYLRLHDLTHDLAIPVIAAVSHDADGGSIALGFGAGASPTQAARHAVGELAQFETNLALIEAHVAERGDGGLLPEARALLRWARTAALEEHPHLRGGDVIPVPRTGAELDLSRCHALCRRYGLQFLALDLTRPSIGVPVARVFVPGLRPMWARFAPGRLYDVPLRLGWRPTPLAEGALNSTPLMF